MADLPGLSGIRILNGNRANPASSTNRQQASNKHVPMVKISGGLASFSGASSAGPSSLRDNEWRRRRALAEHTAEDLTSLNLDTASSGTQVSNHSKLEAPFCSTTTSNYLCGSVASCMYYSSHTFNFQSAEPFFNRYP
jgi:hypothetical protein